MERRRYGRTELAVSPIGFGGGELGGLGAAEVRPERLSSGEAERLLSAVLDAGVNVIDTAECYNDSEERIGRAIGHRRSEYYVFTKCGHSLELEGSDWDPRMLEASLERSLRRLGTDYLDVVHLHTCSEAVLRQGDAIEVLQRAKERGKVRYIGYSGDHTDALYAIQCGAFDSLMTSVNIVDQESIDLLLPAAEQAGLGVLAKRSVANVVWRYEELPPNPYHREYWHRLRQLNYGFVVGGFAEAFEQALRFTLSVPGVHTALIGSTNPNRWKDNASIAGLGPLPKEDYEALRTVWSTRAGADWIGLE